jgi:putative copper export protein
VLEPNSPAGVFARGRIQMFRRFSNLAVLCIALAAAAGMLAWVATIAINILLDSSGGGAAAVTIVQPINESGSNRN